MKFSVIIPTYKCSRYLNELSGRIIKTLETISKDFEIIFINDASPENDWEIITELSRKDKRIKGLNLSRNFGQHYAITAGMDYARGDWIVVMDGDLQDRPEEILKLYNKAKEGYEIVLARRINRQDVFFKRLGSFVFYRIFSYLTNTKQDHSVANFGIYKKDVIDAVISMKDSIRYFPTMSQWVGYNKTFLPVKHNKRQGDKSSYNIKSLINLAFNNIVAFSDKPLKLVVKFGFIIFLFSVILALYYFVKYLSGGIIVLGYSSLIISIWFLSGINIMILGIVGIYIGKIFDKVKNRPMYIIKEKINL